MQIVSVWKSCLVVLLVAALCSCGTSTVELPEPSETDVSRTQAFSFVAALVAPGRKACTGTVVSRHAIVTASHCVQQSGTVIARLNGRPIRFERTYRLSSGALGDSSDLALLVCDGCLPGQSAEIGFSTALGDQMVLVGYGATRPNSRRASRHRYSGSNTLACIEDFLEFWTPRPYRREQSQTAMFGPANRAIAGPGDSGGPAFQVIEDRVILVGIHHSVRQTPTHYISKYVNLGKVQNREFLEQKNTELNLELKLSERY